MTRVEIACRLNAELGESPVWDVDRQVLHFVDIFAKKIHQFDPARETLGSLSVDGTPGALVLRKDGSYLAGIDLSFADVSTAGAVSLLASVSRGDRLNDGKCDARGRLLAGTMSGQQRRNSASLYQMDVDGTVVELLSDVTLSNGMDWSPCGTRFYHADTALETVHAYDYDIETGQVSERRVFVDLNDHPGRPDGLTVDSEGGVWLAVVRAGEVHRYDSAGRLDEVITFPTSRITSCTFGGANLDQLFVTSSRSLLPEAERASDPVAGNIFAVVGLGVKGRPPYRYGSEACALTAGDR